MQPEQNQIPSGEGSLRYQDTNFLEARSELKCSMSVPLFLQMAQETASGMYSLFCVSK